jgi:hypothetical protein
MERFLRYWPILLILLGVYLLYGRVAGMGAHAGTAAQVNPGQEVHHDQR